MYDYHLQADEPLEQFDNFDPYDPANLQEEWFPPPSDEDETTNL